MLQSQTVTEVSSSYSTIISLVFPHFYQFHICSIPYVTSSCTEETSGRLKLMTMWKSNEALTAETC